ncbi:cyclic nucleotide-binding protein [Rhodococcus wratislaviensis]|uniref:histidine kinase n=3 Tax=Rhodococcus TaxID=1827 RepID=A0AB38FKD6_RHOWR|nr:MULTISPECIES: ATP-binding protein [Rhodococcus]AII07091.1 histidine kinase [Rhodococcus opacus]REE74507.1 cyclic nucleotide-binding protein [Rhodococcus wratislaviensis]GAF43505.1 putative two-component histidine kinase [Rhodococcus wratislaviensis NBRC 100605]SPZ41956.1 sensor kinase, two-component system [Rhodococcus wratislaviensis]
MTQLSCNPPELRTLFLFEKLTDHQLEQLCEKGHVELIEPGPVYAEGEVATCFYVLIEGELVLSKLSGGEEIEFNRTSQRGVYAGAWQSYLGDRAPQTYTASMRVTAPSRFFVLDADRFGQLMREWFPMAVHLLEGLFFGKQSAKQVVDQRERLLALGSLSAGLTHELNNPAAAAVRATASLRDRVSHMRQKLSVIASGVYDSQALATLIRLQEEAAELVAKAPTLTPLEASDREDELGDWFDDHGVSGGWDLAPTFVQAGLDVPWLERIVASVDDESMVESAIRWLNYTIETELLMNEIADSTARVSTLVNAAKQYSQMDRAPYQRVDLRELLDSSLVMLGRKIGDSVTVVKEYDPTLPQIPAYAAELNQVWTNLIDNAVAAMDGHGTLTVRTRRDGEMALIEIGDTGPGVPEEIRSRIFEPFFTTKPVGEGTGLGLDISWRIVVKKHRGDLRVESEPGDTRFQVRIPIEPEVAEAEGASDG